MIQSGFVGTSGAFKRHEMIWPKRGLLVSRSFPGKQEFENAKPIFKDYEKNGKKLQCQKFPGVYIISIHHPPTTPIMSPVSPDAPGASGGGSKRTAWQMESHGAMATIAVEFKSILGKGKN